MFTYIFHVCIHKFTIVLEVIFSIFSHRSVWYFGIAFLTGNGSVAESFIYYYHYYSNLLLQYVSLLPFLAFYHCDENPEMALWSCSGFCGHICKGPLLGLLCCFLPFPTGCCLFGRGHEIRIWELWKPLLRLLCVAVMLPRLFVAFVVPGRRMWMIHPADDMLKWWL